MNMANIRVLHPNLSQALTDVWLEEDFIAKSCVTVCYLDLFMIFAL